MRVTTCLSAILLTALLSACDFWPKQLKPLARAIEQQTDGQATAMVVSDVVLVSIEHSPMYALPAPELEAAAAGIAEQVLESVDESLESIAVTFYETGITDDPALSREFIFLVKENQAVLSPFLDTAESGAMTFTEIQSMYYDQMQDSVGRADPDCLRSETERLAAVAGDPDTLDPADGFLPASGSWSQLDSFGKRLILGQVIASNALVACRLQVARPEPPVNGQ